MANVNNFKDEVLKTFNNEPTLQHAILKMHKHSMAWFVSQIFCNQQGKPLILLPFQMVALDVLWHKKNVIMMMSRGGGKSWLLGLCAFLKAILIPGSEIVIVGAGLRQSMKVFSYVVKLYNQSPILQDAIRMGPKMTNSGPYFDIGLSKIIALPIGDGEKIRGQRATDIYSDEFATIDPLIFETVIKPFAAVHANPEESVFIRSFCDRLNNLGASDKLISKILQNNSRGNRVVLSGTANYQFNHFYKYFEFYKMMINSHGDINKVKKAMEFRNRSSDGMSSVMSDREISVLAKSWKTYAILRIPYNYIPLGFLDEEVVTADKAFFTPTRFGMEYECKFPADSDGFIKRSIINEATPHGKESISIELYGDPSSEYVMGLDPARDNDNFGCVILKLISGGSQLVYATAWRGKDTPTSAKYIRELVRRFNIVRIAIDKGGGGSSIAETLQLEELCGEDDLPVLPVKEQIEDRAMFSCKGHFIMEVVPWSSQWITQSAHALEGDIQHRRLLFPSYPVIDDLYSQYSMRVLRHSREITQNEMKKIEEMAFGKEDDDFEKIDMGIWDNIESTIDETCAIERTVTPGGVERFDLPETGIQNEGLNVKRRDRFSALVLASYAARVYRNINRNRKSVLPGGSPNTILKRRKRSSRGVNRRGNVMY